MSNSGAGGVVRLRVATRIARREVVRRPGRTLLVALLVAVPVAAMMVAAVFVRTEHLTPRQFWLNQYGKADVVVRADSLGDPPQVPIAPVRALLARSKVTTERIENVGRSLRTVDGHRSLATVVVVSMGDPIVSGMFRVTAGRIPLRPDEVFLTRAAAHDLGVRVGQELRLGAPRRQTLRVTGVGERADSFSESEMVLPNATAYRQPAASVSLVRLVEPPAGESALSLQRLADEALTRGSPWGVSVSPRVTPWATNATTADAQRKVRWSWVLGAVVLTIAGIVIAAAFAAGARRQLVTLGQLAGNGASPGLLYRVLLLQGTWTGFLGALLGVVLGSAVLVLLRPHVDDMFGHATGGYVVRFADLLPMLALGVVAATVAAAIPGRTATRIPVLAALAGRRPLGRVPRWLPVTGALMVAGGLALFGLAVLGTKGGTDYSNVWLLTAIAGSVSVLLGGCAVAPAYVSILEPLAARARGSWRIATRSLARQRTRTGAVVAAIAATSALAIAASALALGAHSENVDKARWIAPDRVELTGDTKPDGSSPPPPALVAGVAHALPHAARILIRFVAGTNLVWHVTGVTAAHASGWETYKTGETQVPSIGIADPQTADLYRLSPSDRDALARHGWLIFGTATGRVDFTLRVHAAPMRPVPPLRTVDAVLLSDHDHEIGSLPRLLVAPARARQLGIPARSGMLVLRAPAPLTRLQRDAVEEVAQAGFDAAAGTSAAFAIGLFMPARGVDPLLLEWALVGLALALVLFVVTANLALSAAETRDERDALTVIGAAPRTMARTSGYKAALLTVMGTMLAIPIGFLPTVVFVHADRGVMPLIFPWRVVTLLAVALPLVGGIVMAAASSAALRLRPVRISTMTYD
jgi:putative ABC transport system permease protein